MSINQNQLPKNAKISLPKKSRVSTESKAHELRKKGDLKEPKTKDPLCAQSKETVAVSSLKRKSSGCSSTPICEEKKLKCQTSVKKHDNYDNSNSSRKGANVDNQIHVAKANKRLSENVKLNAIASASIKESAESNSCSDSHNHENRKKLTAKRKYSSADSHENISQSISNSNLVSNNLSANNNKILSAPDSKQRYKIPKIQSQVAPSSQPNRTNEENILKDADKKKGLCANTKRESKSTTKLIHAKGSIPSNSKVDSQAVSSTSGKESALKNKSIQETKSVQVKTRTTLSEPLSSSKTQSRAMTEHEVSISPVCHAHDNPVVPSRDTKCVYTPRQTIDCTSPSCCNDSNRSDKTDIKGCTRESEASVALRKDPAFTADKQYHSTHFSFQADNQSNFGITNSNSNQSSSDIVDEDEVELMDVGEEIILTNLQEVRNQTSHIFNQSSSSCLDTATIDAHYEEAVVYENVIDKPKSATVIVDTNVLITNLGLIKELLKTDIPDFGKPYILLPWVVMQELDYLKKRKTSTLNSNNATSYKAADAIRFIHTQLMAQNVQLIGQTAYQAEEPSNIPIECNDDRILHCCIQTKKKEGDNLVILLTRDINLINKAVIMSIAAADTQTIWSKLSLTQDSGVKKQPQVTSSSVNSVCFKAGNQTPKTRNVHAECRKPNQQLTLSAAKTNSHLQQQSSVPSPTQTVFNTQSQYHRPTDPTVFLNSPLTAATTCRNLNKDSFTQNQKSTLTASGNFLCDSFLQNQTSPAAKTFTHSQHLIRTETNTARNCQRPRPSAGQNFQPNSPFQRLSPTVTETFNHNQQQRSTSAETFPQNNHHSQTLTNNVLPDGSPQIWNTVPTGDDSQHRNTNTPLKISSEPQKRNVICSPPLDDCDTLVLAKFESVWKIIFDVKQQVSSILFQGHSNTDFQAAIEMCQRIQTILIKLKGDFNSCLSLSPVILDNHILLFERLSSSLNSFYQEAKLACVDPTQPVSYNQLINNFRQGKNRSLLSIGYEQLVAFIEDYHNLYLNYATR